MFGKRNERVAASIKEEISLILSREITDPRIGFITITRVEVSADIRHAKVFFSLIGNSSQVSEVLKGLESAKGYIRHLLAGRITIKFMPEIEFRYDDSLEYSQRISDEIEKIKESDKK